MQADIKTLLAECHEIQSYMEITVSDSPTEIAERLSQLCVYMARTGQMLADARYIQDCQRASVYAEHDKLILKMPATVSTKFIESQTKEANYLVNWLDRINRTCVHQVDALRSMFSFAKEQMKMTNYGHN